MKASAGLFFAAVVAIALAIPSGASPAGARDCPPIPGAVCGSLDLPLDRAHPEEGTTPVAYVFVPHSDPGPAVSAIVPNPGGPGDSTIAYAKQFANLVQPLLGAHDLLLIDPRGVGRRARSIAAWI